MLRIGILNIMHDKLNTKARFDRIFHSIGQNEVALKYYYPVDHYRNRPIPRIVNEISAPINLSEIMTLDGFIVTGAPLDQKPFNEITYLSELHNLLDVLNQNEIPQLYMCWGAMAALNYFYQIDKVRLPQKLFGSYPHHIVSHSPLINGLSEHFFAPHARYSEMQHEQVFQNAQLKTIATTETGMLLLNTSLNQLQTFLFGHLEYGRDGLNQEYQREMNVNFAHSKSIVRPTYHTNFQDYWQYEQKTFFNNWVQLLQNHATERKVTNVQFNASL